MRPPERLVQLPRTTLRIPAVLARGGTSRGLIFKREDLPADRALWDLVFLAALGSPDARQLDGVGAGDSHTSKVAVVSRSAREDADVDFLFGEVAITEARVDYAGNSGNIVAALGPFALDEGWVVPVDPSTPVRIHNANTGKLMRLEVPVHGGAPAEDGDFEMPGVPGPGPRIDMSFPQPAGALTGALLTADGVRSELLLDDGSRIEASLIDAANPVVFVDGAAAGVDPSRSPAELNGERQLLARLQQIRAAAAVRFGLVDDAAEAWSYSPMVPFLVAVFPPRSYPDLSRAGATVDAADMDLTVRVLSLGMVHKSVNVTVSVAITAAALVPGTLVDAASSGAARGGSLRIGHPSGVTTTYGRGSLEDGHSVIHEVRLGRTARRIMEGWILVQPHRLRWLNDLRSGP